MPPSKSKGPSGRRKAESLPRSWVSAGFVLVLLVVGAWFLFLRETPPNTGATSSPGVVASPTASPAPASTDTAAEPALNKVVGRWLRPDGGYVLEIRAVDSQGRLDAAYLNPNPIHVARAEAKVEEGKLTVFVELQDVNYPGSTYRLTYFPNADQLYGVYYQAALGQSFDVDFQRMQ